MRPSPTGAMAASRAGARGGVAPVHLLDVQTPAGDVFHWSDRPLRNIPGVILSAAEVTAGGLVNYYPWLLDVGEFTFYRSTQTDTGSLTVQNLSGDVLQSDFERIVRKSTLEGAMAVYRYFAVDLMWAWIEQHGTLTITSQTRNSAKLSLTQMRQGQDDTPEQKVSETCQLYWGEKRCGADTTAPGATECLYSYASCQVVEHFVGIQTSFEVNNPAAAAQLAQQPVNRTRPW